MPLMYPIKHVFRNWKLFTALLIGITLAATFFAGIWVKSDVAVDQALGMQLSSIRTDMSFGASLNQTNTQLAIEDILSVSGVKSVDTIARFGQYLGFPDDNYTSFAYVQLVSFPDTSRIYDEWLNKPSGGIPENYTYVITGTQLADRVSIGDTITVQMSFNQPKYYNQSYFDVNLTVAGFAELTNDGYAYSTGNIYVRAPGDYSDYRTDLLIIGWDSTLVKLWNSTLDSCGTVDMTFLIDVNRQELISPYNIQESYAKVNQIALNIQNNVLGNYLSYGYINNMLGDVLLNYNVDSQSLFYGFIMVSIPIFFVAWYLGYTVSDVSFNIRRREIGLLSTKGLSSGQIQRMFLTEALVIGVIGGLLGIVGGLILNQYYVGTVDVTRLFSSGMLSPIIAVVTLIFAVVLAVIAVFLSARKASKIAAVDALRNYMPPDKPARKIFPILALILGGYKILVFLSGINIAQLLSQWNYSQGNLFLSVLSGGIIVFDAAMTYVGPLLFFWGFTKLLIRDSTKFQTAASKISSVMGELGALAAKNVRRNPARLASIAFLIALIIGLSVQVTGQIASQEDYVVRNVRSSVGADVTVRVANVSRSQEILNNITQSVSGIRNASIEGSLAAYSVSGRYNTIPVRTIDPDSWAVSAYYEDSWFTGGPHVNQMLKDFKSNNNTIILDRSIAKQLGLNLYDDITIDFSSCARKLRIVGFFGPEPQDASSDISVGWYDPSYVSSRYYSYVPRGLFNMTAGSDIYSLERSWGAQILISLKPGVNGTEVANQIRSLNLDVFGVNSFEEQWQRSVQMDDLNTYNNLQVLDMQSFGLIFAVLSASVGTALIAIVSLKERSREATLMSVRGLSYRQLVWVFLTESLAIITFAVILGGVIGVIVAYGNITASNALISSSNGIVSFSSNPLVGGTRTSFVSISSNQFNSVTGLVMQRLVFPPNALYVIGTYVALIYASTIGAILVMTSQYVTKLEKMVRTR
ncbi:FtsX-like permease family protein [Candidatus Bathycorpusculum sp.]|uniref:FtsX-like permease family protein n=1 Tax=Candidatus Bathycorpusculum sp. TaxID=2994959 RepID=UPI00282C51DC|nr:ABC transporter permease [Candidatus Termitimicrobium sp.]MCL2431064.1 ABC transporter permease [Candidatus Termitimicrobium sp.]